VTQVFLVSPLDTAGSFPDPGNWTPASNTIEVLGTGAKGGTTNLGGGGGGGGAYAKASNVALTFPVPFYLNSVGYAAATGSGNNFGSSSNLYTATGSNVSAESGATPAASPGLTYGGAGGARQYPAGYRGGTGGGSNGSVGDNGGGGGGAAGINGNGADGKAGLDIPSTQGYGGAADNNFVPGPPPGFNGNAGAQWASIYGSGSGGGGANATLAGGNGGSYGGGGGGGGGSGNRASGNGAQGLIVLTYYPQLAATTQVFLLQSGSLVGSFPDPGNFNPEVNKVECIGAGGKGGLGTASSTSGGGGGAGAYAVATNMTLTFPVPYAIAVGGNKGTATNFGINLTGLQSSGNVVSAEAGGSGSSGTAGLGGTAVYPTGYAGGNGGPGTHIVSPPSSGAGGGGAGGPNGAGLPGEGNTKPPTGGNSGAGGAANGNTVAGGTVGLNGVNGTTWDALHGCGSGGGGGTSSTVKGGDGGKYGGGGAGGFEGDFVPKPAGCGNGAPGLIVVSYQPVRFTQVFLLVTGAASFPDPGNWNPAVNTVEIIGSGAQGSNQGVAP
jgi:hypothetical protein